MTVNPNPSTRIDGKIREALAVVMAIIALVACRSNPGSPSDMRFSSRPFGEAFELFESREQKGNGTFSKVDKANFVEATIAQGSGFYGYRSIRVRSSGAVEVVYRESEERFRKVQTSLEPSELDGLFAALNRDRIHQIKGSYRADMNDGSQGFIDVVTTQGRRYCSLDNYFDPVEHTYEYCNREIVPKLASATPVKGRVDPYVEYYRVFPRS